MPQVAINFDSRAVDISKPRKKKRLRLYKGEVLAFRPPPKLLVDEWADQFRLLQAGTSRHPGPWRTDTTPYLREVMRAYNDQDIRHIVLCFGTQLGKTETLYNILGYIIDLEPYSTLLIYPREPDAKTISRSRLQPMIAECPSLAGKIPDKNEFYQTLEMYFPGMVLYLVGSNSAAALSQKACRNILRDEVDKYPTRVGNDADPLSLSEERAKSFWDMRKIIDVSSPTLKDTGIWKQLQKCERIMEYRVPCPHCKKGIVFNFPQLKWVTEDKEKKEYDEDEWKKRIHVARTTAHFECPECLGRIGDDYKMMMLKKGKWIVKESVEGKVTSIGFQLNSLYSPWLTWGEIAEVFLMAQKQREHGSLQALQNFFNGWMAEPWETIVKKSNESRIRERIAEFPPRYVPDRVIALTAGIDVQQNGFYYTVWGWERDARASYMIDYGFLLTWDDVYALCFDREYDTAARTKMRIFRSGIDTGGGATGEGWSKTAEIYAWLRKNSRGVVCGVKGMSRKKEAGACVSLSNVDKLPGRGGKRFGGTLAVFLIDTDFFKQEFFRRLEIEDGMPGAIYFHKETRRDLISQLLSEEKRLDKKGKEVWAQVGKYNHYLDCTVYAMACTEQNFGGGISGFAGYTFKHTAEGAATDDSRAGRSRKKWLPPAKKWL